MKFAFIQAEKAAFPVTVLCRVLGVSRAGFYAAQTRPPAPRGMTDERLAVEIGAIHRESRRRYGSPRVHAELRARGHCTSRKRVARLMRRAGLAARRRRASRVTTQSQHARPLAPNRLGRQFTAPAPDRVWVTDITYLATAEGWLYLAVVLDLFSRRIVGWATSERLGEGLPLEALAMALARRRPQRGVLHHSDRGAQYASQEYRALLARHGIERSMSRPAACWDNAVAESFFATLKVEMGREAAWSTRTEARRALFDYIEPFYNGERRHSTLGHLSPAAFERRWYQRSRTMNLSTKTGQVHPAAYRSTPQSALSSAPRIWTLLVDPGTRLRSARPAGPARRTSTVRRDEMRWRLACTQGLA